jgi:putative transposase
MGVFVQKTASSSPEDRADIERFFRTVATELLPNLPGRTFSNVIERGDYPSKEKAALDIDDLIRLLIVWVVDVYHFSPHKGLGGATPYDTYENLVEQYGIVPWGDTRALRLAFGKRLTRKVQRNGITILGVTYSSEALQRWRLHSRKHEVSVRWHAKDIGCIDVEFDGVWREVGAVVEGFHGRTAQDWVAAARQIRASNQQRARVHEETVLEALADIGNIADAARKRADLLVNEWSPARIEALEDRLFGGFVVASPPVVETAEPSKPKALLGSVIPVGGDAADEVSAPVNELPPAASSANADNEEDIDDQDPDDDWGIE